ncbi:MAG: hypothetical protein GEU79_16825, partial [Acidimicrobiia bacterium]|nr:hypothetical protein [Acidimicrobiia bacterium]
MTTTTKYTSENTMETTEPSGWVRPVGVAAASAVALVIWAIGGALGADYVVPGFTGAPDQVNAVDVIMVAAGISLVGWGFLALLERFTKNARRIWTIVAAALTVLSIVPNALMAG